MDPLYIAASAATLQAQCQEVTYTPQARFDPLLIVVAGQFRQLHHA